MKQAFDLDKYLKIQREHILERIASFDSKLYLEFGGKLFDDNHASRVLPGFDPAAKIKLLCSMKDQVEVLIAVNANDICSNKIRNDVGITYVEETEKLIRRFLDRGFKVNSVVLTFYNNTKPVKEFVQKLRNKGIAIARHYAIDGYPNNIDAILSPTGFGKNDYVKTERPLVIVTAPGPGSGKLETCLSQIYLDSVKGIKSGYAKFETFPVWNIPLNHPVNVAYEAATVDLADKNMIDPFHLKAYGVEAVNYNRDVQSFPLMKSLFERFYGKSPYKSPTDMGVNMLGFAISDDEAAKEASLLEIERRYYQARKNAYLGKFDPDSPIRIQRMLAKFGRMPQDRKTVQPSLDKAASTNQPAMSIELPDGQIAVGRRTFYLCSGAAAVLNAVKILGGIEDDVDLIQKKIIAPIEAMKRGVLHHANSRMHVDEVLIALSISAHTDPIAKKALEQLPKLKDCEAHSSHLLPDVDMKTLVRLGIHVTEEPATCTN